MPRSSRAVVAAVVVALAALTAACTGSDDPADGDATTTERTLPDTGQVVVLEPLHVQDQRIVDTSGRQVLLRGANVNALGEYAQEDPAAEPTAPLTDADWDAMAANGFSAIRLIMSWSLLEPERGEVDEDYVAEVRDAVELANDHGMYVVLDVHQDAWGMQSATPDDEPCPPGTAPSVGWDGAPEWATITDGQSTCRVPASERETAPAVQASFRNFYANTDGIADQLTGVWAHLAGEFADVAGVAGYDLFNEPNDVSPHEENQVAYSQWVQRTIDAIRTAEAGSGAGKAVFVEPLQLYPLPHNALLPQYFHDPNLVFAPHNYAETINDILTVEQTFAIDQQGADELHAALWIGEYGTWDTSPESLEVMGRYAAEEDRRVVGGTWWQWRQTCGDPHSVGGPGMPATEDQVHLITRDCTSGGAAHDSDARYTTEFLRIVGRAFPRAAPGRITSLSSPPGSGGLTVAGADAEAGAQLVVWLPEVDGVDDPLPATTDGLDDVELVAVGGGRILTATAEGGDWELVVR